MGTLKLALLLLAKATLLVAITTKDNVTFTIADVNGTVTELQYPWLPYSECIYAADHDVLTCMQNYNYSTVRPMWTDNADRLRYVSVNCLRQVEDIHNKHFCFCKSIASIQQIGAYQFCRLQNLTGGIFQKAVNLEALDLSDNALRTISPDAFGGLRNLKYLSLDRITATMLPSRLFCDTPGLKFLSMSQLHLDVFPSHSFQCQNNASRNIEVLDMSNNMLLDLPKDSFDYLPGLTSLDLAGNRLVEIYKLSFLGAKSLQYLNMSFNRLKYLFPQFCVYVPNLTSLYLRVNAFDKFDFKEMEGCASLVNLDLSVNHIASIHGNISEIYSIKNLNFSRNDLTNLTVDMSALTSLRELDFSHNSLTGLASSQFVGLSSLQLLNLSHNSLNSSTNFKTLFEPLTSLVSLDLSANGLKSLPSQSFKNLQLLTSLSLADNSIQTAVADCFVGLSALETLNLGNNGLRLIPNGLLDSLTSLEVLILTGNAIADIEVTFWPPVHILQLDHNKLTTVPGFINSSSLTNLDLSYNRIASFPNTALQHVGSLETMDLSHNELRSIPSDVLSSAKSLKQLNLQNNKLDIVVNNRTLAGLGHLERLNLGENQVPEVGPLFSGNSLSSLVYLNLSGNPIDTVNPLVDGASINPSLIELDLSRCQIHTVSTETFAGLEKLEDINLQVNKIETFQRFVIAKGSTPLFHLQENPMLCSCHMTWVRGAHVPDLYRLPYCKAYTLDQMVRPTDLPLDLYLCPEMTGCDQSCSCYKQAADGDVTTAICRGGLTAAPRSLPSTTLSLFLDGNQFSDNASLMPLSTFPDMSTVDLYLNHSKISFLDSQVFKRFSLLQVLDLSVNVLESLSADVFTSQKLLKELYLRGNALTTVKAEWFIGMMDLETLDLSGNQLTTISRDVIQKIDPLYISQYYLGRNPWKCDCTSSDFKEFVSQEKFKIVDNGEMLCGRRRLVDVPRSLFYCPAENESKGVANIIVGALFGGLAFILVFGALLYFRRELLALLYAKTGLHIPGKHKFLPKSFDAFISYDPEDQSCSQYMQSRILPKLRSQRFNLHTSADVIQDIDVTKRAVEDSQCCVVIVSRSFASNPFSVKVFHIADDYCKINPHFKLILLICGDIELPTLEPEVMSRLRKGDYITARSKLWWERLMYELPVPHPEGLRADTDDVSESDVVVFSALQEDRNTV